MAQFTQGMIPLMCCWNWCLISQYKDQVELSINRSCISNSQCSTTNLRHLHFIHLAISKTCAYFTYISWLHDKLTTITAPKDYKITAHIYIELMILTIIKINASINVQNLNEKLYMLS